MPKKKITFDPRGLEVKEGKNVYVRYLRELEKENGAVIAPRDVAEDIQDKPVLVVNNIAENVSNAEYFKNRQFLTTQFINKIDDDAYSSLLAQGQEGPAVEELVSSSAGDSLVDSLAEDFSSMTVGDTTARAVAAAEQPSEADMLADLFGNLNLN
jgi:hypothetical protein